MARLVCVQEGRISLSHSNLGSEFSKLSQDHSWQHISLGIMSQISPRPNELLKSLSRYWKKCFYLKLFVFYTSIYKYITCMFARTRWKYMKYITIVICKLTFSYLSVCILVKLYIVHLFVYPLINVVLSPRTPKMSYCIGRCCSTTCDQQTHGSLSRM